jgi:GT2 family glycosyltransferase
VEPDAGADGAVTVVIATRNRVDGLLEVLGVMRARPDPPPIIVVDNASTDGTAEAVAAQFPTVSVVRLDENLGAVARTVGVRQATTPYVAFADDDSTWAPGSLDRAARVLDGHPDVAVVAATVVVGPQRRLDPVCGLLATSPLSRPASFPGPRVLGFLACGAVVRRTAYLDVGGFDPLVWFLGEETVLAIDLARAGWWVAYRADVVAHHCPRPGRDRDGRRRLEVRNALITAWTRRSPGTAIRHTAALLRRSVRDRATRRGVVDAGRRWRDVLAARRPPPAALERDLRLLERQAAGQAARRRGR